MFCCCCGEWILVVDGVVVLAAISIFLVLRFLRCPHHQAINSILIRSYTTLITIASATPAVTITMTIL